MECFNNVSTTPKVSEVCSGQLLQPWCSRGFGFQAKTETTTTAKMVEPLETIVNKSMYVHMVTMFQLFRRSSHLKSKLWVSPCLESRFELWASKFHRFLRIEEFESGKFENLNMFPKKSSKSAFRISTQEMPRTEHFNVWFRLNIHKAQ
jgi:hypothetical protein